ncbi:MAG: polyketide cyclase [Lysobacteraceae bacterium]
MTRIIELLIALVLVVVIFVVVGLILPSHQSVSNSTETNRPLPVVFDMMNGFKRFKDWSPVHNLDPKAQFSLSGAESGPGARVDYSSENRLIGSGSWQIASVKPGEQIVYDVTNNDYGTNKTMTFDFKRTGNQMLAVQITQTYDVDYGFNLFGRYAGLYVSRSVGDVMKSSLASLSTFLSTIPKFDYTQLVSPPKVVQIPAENLLIAPTKAKRANDDVEAAMLVQEKWLHQVMDKNGLEAAGPLRIVTINYGPEIYEFNVAIPVRKTGATTPAGAAPPQLTVTIDGDKNPVQYMQSKPTSAIAASYSGHMAQLPAIREAMKAWGITHGYDVGASPYSNYTKGIASSFTTDGAFDLYWPIKVQDSK